MEVMLRFFLFSLYLFHSLPDVSGRRHILKLKNDMRGAILCSHFGYLKGGYFSVSIEQLAGKLQDITFTLDKSESSGVSSYLDAKSGNCFRGNPQKFLYLSFDLDNEQMVIHNQDIQLQGLVFEAISKNMDEETGQNTIIPATMTDAIQLTLESLYLVPNTTTKLAAQLDKLITETPELRRDFMSYEQSSVYFLLRRLAQMLLGEDLKGIENPESQDSDYAAVKGQLSDSILQILRALYQMTTPAGSLRVIPLRRKNDVITSRFTVRFPNASEEGLYSFYIHNCPPFDEGSTKRHAMNLTLHMVEKNTDSYLSAGQRPLPLLYFVMFCVYLFASVLWLFYLRVSKNSKYRIHYLMFAVIFVKAISLAFHGVNYYVIGKHGVHEEGWAVMYYITHIIRGALLFITILLIGAGWAFIKHMLTPRERNVFLIVIPLQILANVATVVIEESEAGSARYMMWKDILIFVDLACCGAILFPVVWSIRHLQTASQTDGKAAVNLRNLRLFRHFYILVICYVYFTRVVAYLLTITVPFYYSWTVELFRESITFIFFVAVGYKFRPVDDNPYLLVSSEDDEEDTVMERIQLEDMWSQSGVTDGVTRLARPQPNQKSRVLTEGKLNQAFLGQHDDTESVRSATGV